MKSYIAPTITELGTVEHLTLAAGGNAPSGAGNIWIKPGGEKDPGMGGLATKVKK